MEKKKPSTEKLDFTFQLKGFLLWTSHTLKVVSRSLSRDSWSVTCWSLTSEWVAISALYDITKCRVQALCFPLHALLKEELDWPFPSQFLDRRETLRKRFLVGNCLDKFWQVTLTLFFLKKNLTWSHGGCDCSESKLPFANTVEWGLVSHTRRGLRGRGSVSSGRSLRL